MLASVQGFIMPIDQKLYRSPAIRGDISGVAIDLTMSLEAIASALEKISAGGNPDIGHDLEIIRKASKSVMGNFDRLVGWTNDAG